jgi:hypothetical protein
VANFRAVAISFLESASKKLERVVLGSPPVLPQLMIHAEEKSNAVKMIFFIFFLFGQK